MNTRSVERFMKCKLGVLVRLSVHNKTVVPLTPNLSNLQNGFQGVDHLQSGPEFRGRPRVLVSRLDGTNKEL